MKDADAKYIQEICDKDLNKDEKWMTRAQVMLKNIRPLKENIDGNKKIPIEALEKVMKLMVKKYRMSIGHVLVITGIKGEMSYHAGMSTSNLSKNVWLFTIHADTIYETYVKLVLMSFVAIKQHKVVRRK